MSDIDSPDVNALLTWQGVGGVLAYLHGLKKKFEGTSC